MNSNSNEAEAKESIKILSETHSGTILQMWQAIIYKFKRDEGNTFKNILSWNLSGAVLTELFKINKC